MAGLITLFNPTSARVRGADLHTPCIKSCVTAGAEWKMLTFPPAGMETKWGESRVVIDVIRGNRTSMLRASALLSAP